MDKIPAELDTPHRRCVVASEPMIFHCHHYNTFLQRSILDAPYIDSVPSLVGAAADLAHTQLGQLFAQHKVAGISQRKAVAERLYRWAGFGVLDLGPLDAGGGKTRTPHSHYGMGWHVKFGQAASPVCHFAAGWLAGALAAIHDRPNGSYAVQQTACLACGDAACAFELTAGKPGYHVYTSVGVGSLTEHRPRAVPRNNVDYDGIYGAVTGMELVGNQEGIIPAFGVYLTRHYANYYNRISFEFLRAIMSKFGETGREAGEPLLVEAGHVCAFHTFGGVMTSTEWDALIRPSLKSREDWVHGMVAVTNTFGWGRWQVTKLSEAEAEFVIHDDYESVGYVAMYGQSKQPVSLLAQGGVAGLMNLVYLGDIANKPKLDAAYYNSLFRQPTVYRAEALTSQAMGHDVTSFRVTRTAG